MIDSEAEVSTEVLLEYEKLLKKSYTENYDELFKTDLLKVLGKDGYGYNIVMLIPCFIAATETDPEKILRYAIMRMDPVVRENYVLILCETHTGWLMDTLYMYAKQWYDVLPRMYKKNLKKLYIIHSSFLSKTILTVLSPLLSANFWKKVEYVEKLEDIFLKLNVNPTYYLKHFPYIVQRNEEVLLGVEPISFFGADLEILCQRFGKPYMEFKNIPSLLVNFLDHLTKPEIMNTKDLFSLQTDANTLYGIIGDIEYGEPTTDFDNIPALVCSFKLFLDVQKHGLLGKDAFVRLLELKNRNKTKVLKVTLRNLYNKLERGTQQCVLCLLKFFKRASLQSNQNNMTPEAISKTFSSTFFRPRKPYVNFQECIPFANKCLMLLIENPDILTSQDTSDDDDSETTYESNSSATEGGRGKSSKLSANKLYSDEKVKKNSRGGSSTSSDSSSTSSSSDKSSESSSDSDSSSRKSNLKKVKTKRMPSKTSKATEYSKAPVKVKSNSDVDDSDDSDESDDSERKGKKKEDTDDDEDDSEESATTSVSDTDTNTNTKNLKDASSKEDKESVTSASSKSKTTNSSSASSGSNESSEEESEVESKKDAPQKKETNKTPENTDSDEDSTSETDLTSNKMKKMSTKKFSSSTKNSKTERKESTDESTNEKRETEETSEDDSDAGRSASRVSRAADATSDTSAATSSVSEDSEEDTLKNTNKKKRNMPGKLKTKLSNNYENSGTTGKDQSRELGSGSKSTSEHGTSSSSSSQSDSDSDDE